MQANNKAPYKGKANQQSIFHEVKEHLKSNIHCLGVLFPNAKLKGVELYFDSPSYNSWSYNIHKGVAKDFRSNERQDIIEIYRIFNNLPKSIDAAKAMASVLGIKTKFYKGRNNG